MNTVCTTVQDRVATITLNKPERLNAIDHEMALGLLAAIDEADRDPDVGAIVVTGNGRAFCAGADLRASSAPFRLAPDGGAEADAAFRDITGTIGLRLFDCHKPVIAAVNGPAVGFGASILCAMDARLATEDATFAFAYARRGMVAEGAVTWFLPRLVGAARAAEWLLRSRSVPADEALTAGLVSAIHPHEQLLGAACAMARETVTDAAPVSIALARRLLWLGLTLERPHDVHLLDSQATLRRGRSADVAEGIEAFLAKRPPRFPERVPDDLPEIPGLSPW